MMNLRRLMGAFLLLAACAIAQAPPSPTSSAPAAVQQHDTEEPFRWGFEGRTRTENWDNIIDFNHTSDDLRQQVRYRMRQWLEVPVTHNFGVNVGLVDEFYQFVYPSTKLNLNEIAFESLSVDVKKVFVPKLSLRVGRQNLVRGEGFILMDGTSGDGSRTSYFNALDVRYQWKKDRTLELIGILDPRRDRFLPRIHDQHRLLTEWDEQAVGLYFTDHTRPNRQIEAYYFLKKEIHDFRKSTDPQFQPDRHISTAGARLVQHAPRGLTVTGEGAMQWGVQHPDVEIRGWSAYGYAKKDIKAVWKPYVLAGYWALSGDNPRTTNRVEGWDPLFSRWPKWGDLYLYSFIPEKGVGYATNNRFSQVEAGIHPLRNLAMRATWYHQSAFHSFAGSAKTFGPGTGRGDLMQVRTDFTLSKSLSGHLVYESFTPGDFYAHRSSGYFLRGELVYSYTGQMRLGKHH